MSQYAVCEDRHWTVFSVLIEFSTNASALCMQFYSIWNISRYVTSGSHAY